MAEKKQEYVVIKPNTRDYEVGEKVKLTDEEVRKLINKVRLADSGTVVTDTGAAELKAAQDELADVKAKLAERDGQLESAQAELKAVQDELADAQLAKMTGSGKK